MKKIHKILSIVLVLFLLGWGISSLAEDDISSAHSNFSVVGIISDISDDVIKIEQSKGSDNTDRTSYDLNINHLNRIETDKYVSINKADLKKGDKIIAQGLTNGSTFFIKRIVSFSHLVVEEDITSSTPQELSVSSSTDDIMMSASTESVDQSTSVSTSTDNTPVITDDLINDATTNTDGTSTTDIIVSTTTEESSTSTSTTTDNIIDKVVDTVQDVVDVITETVTDVVENIIDTVSNNNENQDSATTPVDVAPVENQNSSQSNENIVNE